ncbi:hypothetical protein TGRUB_432820 [Toxoplasma gondii RUB]|uniref:Uncharacterized protein n=1 Tax=Toxoplasma gondii RUB TaxID=935652 RepID=A0A086LPS0_TOXGO|nr:hypothetical protein TGRUB_432820 [Toxoplasma gondii RUB]
MPPANPPTPPLGCTSTEENRDHSSSLRHSSSHRTSVPLSYSSLSSSFPSLSSSCSLSCSSSCSLSCSLSCSSSCSSSCSPCCSLDAVTGLGGGTQQHEALTRQLVQEFFSCLGQDLARFEREVHYLANQIKYPPPPSSSSSSSSSPSSSTFSPPSLSPSSPPSSSPSSSSSSSSSSNSSSSSSSNSSSSSSSLSASRPFRAREMVAAKLLEQVLFQRKQAEAHRQLSVEELVEALRSVLWANGEKIKQLRATEQATEDAGRSGEERREECGN